MAKKKAKKAVKAKKVQKSDNEKIIAALAYIVVGLIQLFRLKLCSITFFLSFGLVVSCY